MRYQSVSRCSVDWPAPSAASKAFAVGGADDPQPATRHALSSLGTLGLGDDWRPADVGV
jgi:hypothetical protein